MGEAAIDTTEQVINANVAELVLSPINYRTKLGPPEKFKQLCESVAAKGVLQPITIRPAKAGKGHEVVFGNRRFAAAQKAGLKTILAVVRDIPDAEVLELQVIENAEREDPSPLEEARAFDRLVKDHGRTVQQIAERINRPATYVAQRLKLLTLAPTVLAALDEEKITLAVAMLIARVPSAKLQQEALDAIDDGRDYNGMPMKADEVRKLLEEQYLLRLDQAPFDTTDAKLVPKAGACTACPKTTGNQRQLFPDVKSPDLCTDPVCHRSKLDALWKIRVKEAEKGGPPVIDGKDGRQAVNESYGGTYVRLDHEEWVGKDYDKKKTVREIVAKANPPVFLARDDETGEIVQAIRRADLTKVLDKGKKETAAASADDSYAARQRREKAKTKLRREAIQRAVAIAIEKATQSPSMSVLELVVRAYAGEIWDETQRAILAGRGIDDKKGDVRTKIRKLVRDCAATEGDLLGLGLELALRAGAPWHGPNGSREDSTLWSDALKLAGVDFPKLERQVAEEAKAAKKGKGKKPPAEASEKPKARKPAKKGGRK